MNRRVLLWQVVFCWIVIFGFITNGEAKKVRVGLPSATIPALPYYTAQEKGFYNEEGLEVELILIRAPVANQAVIAGSIDFSTVQLAGLIAAFRGAPLQILFSAYTRPLFIVYAKPDIRTIEDLKGKKVGTSGPGAAPDVLLREFLEKRGIEPDKEVALLNAGTSTARVAALKSGAIDASIFTVPDNFRVEEFGFRRLASFLEQDLAQLYGSIVARKPAVQADPETTTKFIRATLKGLLYIREKRSEVIPIMVRHLGIAKAIAGKAYDLTTPVTTRDGTVDKEFLEAYLRSIKRARGVKKATPVEDFFDFSLTKKIYGELKAQGWKP